MHDADRAPLLRRIALAALMLVAAAGLGGCENGAKTRSLSEPPVPIVAGDACHVCGMYIGQYPGPEGEVYVEGHKQPFKFGGTRDMFTWLLQADHRELWRGHSLYVQDMSATDWCHPEGHFIDARIAWYVIEQPLPGEMGPTLASFRTRGQAEDFVRKYGGRILRFQDVTLTAMENLDRKSVPPPSEICRGQSLHVLSPGASSVVIKGSPRAGNKQ